MMMRTQGATESRIEYASSYSRNLQHETEIERARLSATENEEKGENLSAPTRSLGERRAEVTS